MFDELRSHYLYQPREVSFETFALCNARCTFCPYPTLDRKGEKMSDELIASFVDQMRDWTQPFTVSPFKVNEPLLDTRLQMICETILSECPAARLRIFTNGAPLTEHHIAWIARLSRLDHLWVSLNCIDPDEYERVMGLKFEITQRRLDALHACLMSEKLLHAVVVSRVASDDTAENYRFVEYVTLRWPLFQPFIIKRDGWLGYCAPQYTQVPQMPCGRWFELSIMATGKVALCCMDGTGEFSIGDAVQTPLLEIYNQPHLIERRQFAVRRTGIDPCERCTY